MHAEYHVNVCVDPRPHCLPEKKTEKQPDVNIHPH